MSCHEVDDFSDVLQFDLIVNRAGHENGAQCRIVFREFGKLTGVVFFGVRFIVIFASGSCCNQRG